MKIKVDIDALTKRLIDDFSRTVLRGAFYVAQDADNPIRGNLFASAIREAFTHMLHKLAPDEEVKQCSWFKPESENGRLTRAQRLRYMIQGGLSDEYVADELKLDVASLHMQLGVAVKKLNRATHIREGTVIYDETEVESLAGEIFAVFEALLDAVDHSRAQLMVAIDEAAVDEATNEVLSETIQTIDELATHHSIEEVYVDSVRTIRIDAHYVWYRATGTIAAELQWGSNSDLRRGDGAVLPQSFPFECDIPASVDDPTTFETSMTELRVDDGGWRDSMHDE
jgi:hypothetical protein